MSVNISDSELALFSLDVYGSSLTKSSSERYLLGGKSVLNGWSAIPVGRPDGNPLYKDGSFGGGLYINKSTGVAVIAFRGTDDTGDAITDLALGYRSFFDSYPTIPTAASTALSLLLHRLDADYKAAQTFYNLAMSAASDFEAKEIVLTGHSLGGGWASIFAFANDQEAVVFNPAPWRSLGNELRSLAGSEPNSASLVRTITVKDEAIWKAYTDGALDKLDREGQLFGDQGVDFIGESNDDHIDPIGDLGVGLHYMGLSALLNYDSQKFEALTKQIPQLISQFLNTAVVKEGISDYARALLLREDGAVDDLYRELAKIASTDGTVKTNDLVNVLLIQAILENIKPRLWTTLLMTDGISSPRAVGG